MRRLLKKMKLKKSDLIFIAGIILIIASFFIILNEIKSAKDFCNSINESYSFLPDLRHACNHIPIFKYNSNIFGKYWDFSPRNFKVNLPI